MSEQIVLWVPEGKDRIYARTPFELADAMRSLPGRLWDGDVKCWHVPATAAAAEALWTVLAGRRLSVDARVADLLRESEQERQALIHKDAAELPEIPGRMPAWLHQKRAFHFAAGRRSTMLAMDMGTGKSRTAVSLLDHWQASTVVILCPSSVMGVWPNQFALHSEREWRAIYPPQNMTVAKRVGYIARQMNTTLPTAIIVNYEASWREPMKSLLTSLKGFVLILDESHRVKAAAGVASRFVAKLGEKADHVLALTGTPMPHSPLDIYAQFRVLDPGIFGTNHHRFKMRYAVMGGFENRQVIGYQNEAELAEKFARASFVVKKDEAGLDLPDVVHTQRTFELTPRSLKAYLTLDADFILGVGEGTVTPSNALVKLLRLQQVTSGFVRDDDGTDHQVGTEKIKVLEDVLADIPDGEPVVIFARFKHDLALIRALVEKLGLRYGEVSGDCKKGDADHGLNEHSQMREDVDVVALQLQSGGVGIDLTRAAYAVYYSLDFSLGNYEQSLARLDRPGQKRKVTYFHLVATGTKDEVVYTALQERKNVVEAVIAASRGTTADADDQAA